ncbi:MAG: ChaN family lipoprotein [Gemmatimonadota bacterium]
MTPRRMGPVLMAVLLSGLLSGCAAGVTGNAGPGRSLPPGHPVVDGPNPHGAAEGAAGEPDVTPFDLAALQIFQGGPEARPRGMAALLEGLAEVDVILVGEHHDDPGAHALQLWLLDELSREATRPVILSLESFERDVQGVLDEYLAGIITEEHFLAVARPWGRYGEAHRPLVELAREREVPVVAANTPRRYVNRVGRLGVESLMDIPSASLGFLPPLPFPGPSARYREAFNRLMGSVASENLLQAQALWDAGMAHSVVRSLENAPEGAIVLHVAGSFHVEGYTGIPEVIRRYRPETRVRTVVVRPRDTEGEWEWLDGSPGDGSPGQGDAWASAPGGLILPPEFSGLGDFVVVSPPR